MGLNMIRAFIASALAAISFIVTPALADTWTVGQQPVVYPIDRFPVLGDGSTTWGGTPPYYANMPADINDPAYQLADFTAQDSEVQSKTQAQGAQEAKMRTECGTPSHFGYDDPIIYPGQQGASHGHQFFGNTLTDYRSTYRSLRTTGRSNCGGDVFNRTAYWTPWLDVNGKILRPDQFVLYYVENPIQNSNLLVDIPRDFAYVSGPDPMTGYISQTQTEIDAANAAAVSAGAKMRYKLITNGFVGWKCENPIGNPAGTTAASPNVYDASTNPEPRQPYLKTASGQLTLNCNNKMPDGVTNARILAEFNGADCWDGVNGHGGPTGRGHVRFAVLATDTSTGVTTGVCPDHWHRLPRLIEIIYYPFPDGMNEVMSWRWSSDINSNYNYENGKTGHIDWFGAWQYGTETNKGVMLRWMRSIGTMGNTPHEMNYSTIDNTTRLLTDSQIPTNQPNYKDYPGSIRGGRIVDSNHDWASKGNARFVAPPKGPYTVHMGHGM